MLFVLEASGTSVACYEAPNFVDFTLFSMGLELVECILICDRTVTARRRGPEVPPEPIWPVNFRLGSLLGM